MNHRTGKEYKLRRTFNNSIASWPCLVFLESLPSIDRSGSVKDRRFPNMHLTWYEWFRAPILKVISKKTYFFSPKVLSNESIFSPQKEVRMIFLIGTGSFFPMTCPTSRFLWARLIARPASAEVLPFLQQVLVWSGTLPSPGLSGRLAVKPMEFYWILMLGSPCW